MLNLSKSNKDLNIILQKIYNRFDAKTIKNEIFDKNLSGYGEYNTDILEYFRDCLQAIIHKEYKNPSSEWYYPFDIKLFVDQLDKEYYNESWLNCRSAKEEFDFGIDNTKEKRILYIANMLSYFAEASKNFIGIEIGHPYNNILDRFLK